MTLSPTIQGLAFLAVNSVMYSSRMYACVYMCMRAFIYTHRISSTVDVIDVCVPVSFHPKFERELMLP